MQISSTFSFITEYINYIREARQETDKFRDSINRTSETERNANLENGRTSRPYNVRDEFETYDRQSSQFTGNPLDYREQIEEYSSPASQRHFRTVRRDIVDNSQTDDDFNYNTDRNTPLRGTTSRYSQSEIMSTLPASAMGDLEKYRSLLIQREEQNRFFANKGIDLNNIENMTFGKDRYGYDIQEDYKKRFGSNIEDTSARDKLSDGIKKTLQVLEQKSNNTFDYKNFDPYRQPEAKKSMTVQQALGKNINELGQNITDLTGSAVAGGLAIGAATSAIQLGTQAIKQMATTMYENNLQETTLKNLAYGDTELVDDFVAKNRGAVTQSEVLAAATNYAKIGVSSEQQGMAMELAKDLAYATGNGDNFSGFNDLIYGAMKSSTGDSSEILEALGVKDLVDISDKKTIDMAFLAGQFSGDYTDAFKLINEYASRNDKFKNGLASASEEKQKEDWWGDTKRKIINGFTTGKSAVEMNGYGEFISTNDENTNKYNYDYTSGKSNVTLDTVKAPTNILTPKSNDTIAKSAQNGYMSNVNNNKTANFTINLYSTGNTEEDAKKMADTVYSRWDESELTNVGSVNISGSR